MKKDPPEMTRNASEPSSQQEPRHRHRRRTHGLRMNASSNFMDNFDVGMDGELIPINRNINQSSGTSEGVNSRSRRTSATNHENVARRAEDNPNEDNSSDLVDVKIHIPTSPTQEQQEMSTEEDDDQDMNANTRDDHVDANAKKAAVTRSASKDRKKKARRAQSDTSDDDKSSDDSATRDLCQGNNNVFHFNSEYLFAIHQS